MRPYFLFIVSFIAYASFAYARGPINLKNNAQWAEVKDNAAMVFMDPDFDADVIAYLEQGQRIAVSKKSFGAFRKVRLDDNRIGYISTAEVRFTDGRTRGPASDEMEFENRSGKGKHSKKRRPSSEDDSEEHSSSKRKKKKNPYFQEPTKEISDSRYVGAFASYQQVTGDYAGARRTGGQGFFGLRLTSPNILSFSPYLSDVNLGVAFGPPTFYSIGADSSSGYAIWVDAAMLWPLTEQREFVWYIGGGPMLGYQSYKVIARREITNYDNFKFGLDLLTGVGVRVQKVLIRLDVKYWIESTSYPAVTLGVQHQF